jgi:hypothetical protein
VEDRGRVLDLAVDADDRALAVGLDVFRRRAERLRLAGEQRATSAPRS